MLRQLEKLCDALRCLPGVGPKSAQRMAFHLLETQDRAAQLAAVIEQSLALIQACEKCRNYCENHYCTWCEDPDRDPQQLCIVETPLDVNGIEETGLYRGHYFVLRGLLSPLSGKGPQELGLDGLATRLHRAPPQEIILAISSTVEADATAYYIAEMVETAGAKVKVSRIASGIPLDGDLSWVSARTLTHAFSHRESFDGH